MIQVPEELDRLIWLDLEMTGLNPETDRIIEMAMVITDANLNTIAESPVLAIHQDDDLLNKMDSWNTATHTRSGLVDRVKESAWTEEAAEEEMLRFLKKHVSPKASPMCGNTIGQDRRFLAKYMPKLEDFFHYRNLDVSTLKELARRWRPDVVKSFQKRGKHQAQADIYESIDELKHYREHFLRMPEEQC